MLKYIDLNYLLKAINRTKKANQSYFSNILCQLFDRPLPFMGFTLLRMRFNRRSSQPLELISTRILPPRISISILTPLSCFIIAFESAFLSSYKSTVLRSRSHENLNVYLNSLFDVLLSILQLTLMTLPLGLDCLWASYKIQLMQMKRQFLSPSTRRFSSIKSSKLNFYSPDESVLLYCSTWSIALFTVSLIDIVEGLCVNFET